MDKQPLDAVLFDMDGTLLDSEWFYYKAWKSVLDEYGIAIDSQSWANSFAGKTDGQAFSFLQEHYRFDVDAEQFRTRKNARIAELAHTERVDLMPGARELVAYLTERQLTLAVVTSSKRPAAEYHLKEQGLLDAFRLLVTRSEVTHPKPHPEPYQQCVRQLGVAQANCIVLEDSATGATAAKAAGLTCYGVQSHAEIRQALTMADRLFVDLHEVLAFIQHKAS